MSTKVIFRKYKDGQIIALFPEIPWNTCTHTVSSYMHLGQHGGADYAETIPITQPACKNEYQGLLTELETIGYTKLRIVKRSKSKFH
jgi:hypothetical protein